MNKFGMRILENPHLTVPGVPYAVRRTWRERLFTRPWRPLQRDRMVTPMLPSRSCYILSDGSIAMHPETARALRAALAEREVLA